MKKKLLFLGISLMAILMVTAFSATASAITNEVSLNGKGAIAQWNEVTAAGNHVINAYVIMDGNGKNAEMYVSIDHHGLVSEANGPAKVQWSMNHVEAEANLTFGSVINGRSGTHIVSITWITSGNSSHDSLSANSAGLVASVTGQWKSGAATMTLDPTATAGHHQDNTYDSGWAVVFFGNADLSLTFPSSP